MKEQSVVHNTFVIERSYAAPPARVFTAFSEPESKRRWFATSESHDLENFEMDFRAGGCERQVYRFNANSPFPGTLLKSDGSYQDVVPNSRIVMASTMTLGERHISSSLTTFEFLETASGTDLIFTHQAAFYEGSDGPAMRERGWRKLLDSLGTELGRS